MFIASFIDGTNFTESDGTWDELPDKLITKLQLTLPVQLQVTDSSGLVKKLPSPTVSLESYDKFYFANEAVAVVFRTYSGNVFFGDGKGDVTKQVIAGIDEKHDFVCYVTVDKKSNVEIKRFPIKQFKVRPETLKKGSR